MKLQSMSKKRVESGRQVNHHQSVDSRYLASLDNVANVPGRPE